MTYYDTIPDIVVGAIQSIYRVQFVDAKSVSTARLFDFINTNPTAADVKVVLAQLALVVCVALGGFILFTMIQKRALKAAKPPAQPVALESVATPIERTGILRSRWNTLVAHLDSTHESQWKVAVMEADKLVDDALAKAGFPGATFGDRLSNIQPGDLLSLDGIWWAHKIRNRLAHEVDYFLRYTEARQAVGYYEAALSELKLI